MENFNFVEYTIPVKPSSPVFLKKEGGGRTNEEVAFIMKEVSKARQRESIIKWKINNPDKVKLIKDRYNEKQKNTITKCPCGKEIQLKSLSNHKESKAHKLYLELLTNPTTVITKCPCSGKEVSKKHQARHNKTKSHMNYLEQQK